MKTILITGCSSGIGKAAARLFAERGWNVVATMRDSEELGNELLDLLARLRRTPSMEQIALGGLDEAETFALVMAREGGDVGDDVIARLHADTDGNPFFIEELLRGGEDLGVPEGVKAMIARRLARLDELTGRVVTVASVVGREFRLEVLEALVDEPVERLISALEAAIGAGLIREVEDDVVRLRAEARFPMKEVAR